MFCCCDFSNICTRKKMVEKPNQHRFFLCVIFFKVCFWSCPKESWKWCSDSEVLEVSKNVYSFTIGGGNSDGWFFYFHRRKNWGKMRWTHFDGQAYVWNGLVWVETTKQFFFKMIGTPISMVAKGADGRRLRKKELDSRWWGYGQNVSVYGPGKYSTKTPPPTETGPRGPQCWWNLWNLWSIPILAGVFTWTKFNFVKIQSESFQASMNWW